MTFETDARRRETVTAFFESRNDAMAALDKLRHAGIPVDEARLHDGDDDLGEVDRDTRHKGFWERLGDLFLPTEDRGAYAEGLSRGGTLLSLPLRPQDRARAIDILDDEGTVDMDERQASWRSEGWGGPASSPAFGDAGLSTTGTAAGGDLGLTSPGQDAGLRSGISGIGAHSAGAPPASYARRDETLGRSRVRAYRYDEPEGEALRQSEIEIDDERDLAERGRTGTTGRSPL